jgi:hypothetical protein
LTWAPINWLTSSIPSELTGTIPLQPHT